MFQAKRPASTHRRYKIKDCPQDPALWIYYFFFCKYLLSDYCLPGTAVGAEDLAGKKMDMISAFFELTVQWRRQTLSKRK